MIQFLIVLPLVFVPLVVGIMPIDISINESPAAVISAPNSFLPISLETSAPKLQPDRTADTAYQERNKIITEAIADLLKIFLGGLLGILVIERIRAKQEKRTNQLESIESIIKI